MSGTTRFSLGGRTALITGASSGLGARMALVASEQGAAVALVGRRLDRETAIANLRATRGLDGAFLLLASEAGRLITGVTLPVDSGATVM